MPIKVKPSNLKECLLEETNGRVFFDQFGINYYLDDITVDSDTGKVVVETSGEVCSSETHSLTPLEFEKYRSSFLSAVEGKVFNSPNVGSYMIKNFYVDSEGVFRIRSTSAADVPSSQLFGPNYFMTLRHHLRDEIVC